MKIRPGESLSDQEIDEMFRQADVACDFEQASYAAVTTVGSGLINYYGLMVTPCVLIRGFPIFQDSSRHPDPGFSSLCCSLCPDFRVLCVGKGGSRRAKARMLQSLLLQMLPAF